MKISVVYPIYLPSDEYKRMTDKNLYLAKERTQYSCEWVIVETCSNYYKDCADVYLYEPVRTTCNQSVNKAFRHATGEFVVFIANDVEVCNQWIEKMLECFQKKADCGIASLGNNEHNDDIRDEIVEDLYFTVSMFRKEDAFFDSFYTFVFDDTDMIFRLYTQGKKFYKNLSGKVFHKPHSTIGSFGGDKKEFERSKQYFINKWKDYHNDPFFKKLAGI